MDCSPRIAQLCFSLAVLSGDLTRQLDALTKRLGCPVDTPSDDCLILSAAPHNIVDRKKDKQRHQKQWKITLKEKIEESIEYERLD